MVLLETILIASAAALGGVIVGAAIQKTAKFLYPYDWMTLTIVAAIAADTILQVTGIDPVWYPPFLLGYLVGYVIVGRTRYTMVMDINVVSKTMRMRPWVLYMHDDKLCIQEQTNRALLRRQVFGVRHIVVSVDNVSISADWFSDSKYPMFPAFEKNLLVLEDLVVDYSTVHVIWRINARQYVTRIRVAYGSMASKLELMRSANVLTDQQNTIVSLANEVNELQTALGPQLMEMAISIDKKAVSTSPENRMYSMIKKNKQKAEPVQEVNKDGPSEGAAQTE